MLFSGVHPATETPIGPVIGAEDKLPYCLTCWLPDDPDPDENRACWQGWIPIHSSDAEGLVCSSCDEALS